MGQAQAVGEEKGGEEEAKMDIFFLKLLKSKVTGVNFF